ncbi:hypothetical protein F5Y15DRAFT_378812 [Xylariaceae sp. FL0016]|nr:hypothetical protein F5Y15DRAFT_378812 [Xylariaceae sp. FL0016]
MIELAAFHCKGKGYAYYYCLYSRAQDETHSFLKWTVSQLCRQAGHVVPTKLHEARQLGGDILADELLDCLQEISALFEHVYIIVDAVDESRPRDKLIDVLMTIGTTERFSKVSLLFTSRQEIDIVRAVDRFGDACTDISMANNSVREDIQKYVRGQLERASEWSEWRRCDSEFLSEIEEQVAKQAHGMFRWAVCQLDVLKRKRDKESIREALRKLPKDIFDTYQRILTDIPERDREFARTALALICSDTAHIPTAEVLVSACLYNVPYGDVNIYSVNTLSEICGSLITLSPLQHIPDSAFNRDYEEDPEFHRVVLAHYTVKEFLFYPGTATGPAKFFALSNDLVQTIDLTVIFNGLGHFGLRPVAHRKDRVSRYEEYCLAQTEQALSSRRSDIMRNDELRKLVLQCLKPTSKHFMHLRQQNGLLNIMRTYFPRWNELRAWEQWPANSAAGILVHLALLDWLELAKKYLESEEFPKPRRREYPAKGVSSHKTLNALKKLLGACAKPDPKPLTPGNRPLSPERESQGDWSGFAFTPLQMAVRNLNEDWVEALLDEGAKPNAVGTPKGVMPFVCEEVDTDATELRKWQRIGHQSPLKICAMTKPQRVRFSVKGLTKTRGAVDALLRRYGADDFDEMEIDEEVPPAAPQIVDLTEGSELPSLPVDEESVTPRATSPAFKGTQRRANPERNRRELLAAQSAVDWLSPSRGSSFHRSTDHQTGGADNHGTG